MPPVATPPGALYGADGHPEAPERRPSEFASIVSNAPNARHRNLSMTYFRL